MQQHGGERSDWERIHDLASAHRHSERTLRVVASLEQAEAAARRFPSLPRARARSSAAAAKPIAAQFSALFFKDIGGVAGESDIWLDASNVAVDGTSGKVRSFVDYVDATHVVTQTNATYQVALPSADADIAQALSASFTNHFYQSNRAASAFVSLAQAATILALFTPTSFAGTGVLAETWSSGNAFSTSIAGTTGALNLAIYRPTTTQSVASVGTNVINVPRQVLYRIRPALIQVAATGLTTNGLVVTGTAAAAGKALVLGARSAGSVGMTAKLRSWYAFRRVLTLAEESVAQQFARVQTGVAYAI